MWYANYLFWGHMTDPGLNRGVQVAEYLYTIENSDPHGDLAESAFLPLLSYFGKLTELNPYIQVIAGVFTELGDEV